MKIQVEHITKRFDHVVAVRDVTFDIESGSLVALLGPSGSGKSTILRILAGLESADAGTVWFDDREVTDLHARDRSIGFVFQSYALFRHMTVAQNIGFGLSVRRLPKDAIRARVDELLELVDLTGLGERLPAQLSGGQQQRVALARALAPEPRLLLLDEPFGAVDAKVREELRQRLRDLHDDVGVTSLFVTHDQDEALSIADQVIILHDGAIEQIGTPAEILDEPASELVASFVGEVNVLPSVAHQGVATAGGLRVPLPDPAASGPFHLIIRSYDLSLWRDEPGIATVSRIIALGHRVRVHVMLDDVGPMVCQMTRETLAERELELGCRVRIEVEEARSYPAPTTTTTSSEAHP